MIRHKRRPPRGMYINHDDLVAMAASPHGQLMLRAMDREIISLKRQVSKYFSPSKLLCLLNFTVPYIFHLSN